jgi:hypothetical protein
VRVRSGSSAAGGLAAVRGAMLGAMLGSDRRGRLYGAVEHG